ncbi:COG2426 family protein [Anaerococcus hydrogenalis]|uniref:Small multi-drug export protein n=2 Tax=Anaerococcus hydrogenalis TaxID=33029 RepID=A0A2N6UJG1_9FIRM|nr:small multi-drug export protein [Anaerococcus hydrogenalis]EGC83911.1 putative small multi-drug export protein [Anaerococcus hydrogenalis ACS-025-V-Sch4]MDK7695141.1 small multi-drug export protein [Anaerococcus hydrogenalis]MDK7696884.1 small multi-drug export protein [Anaerococcus hydrogenalis]MDK7708168.1 small multi-drug export protein [Anaerococcus hydrogenalis]PMC81880.1 small multi-drug export protein [Anaerococcus hydrogenalis]
MQNLIEVIRSNFSNQVALIIISMLPLIELKGSIPIGLAMGLKPFQTYIYSIIGSIVPAIFILMWIMPIFDYMKKKDSLKKLVAWAEKKAKKKEGNIKKYEYLGLFLFVAIPLPGTGIWMGSLIASILGLKKMKSFLTISVGNVIAGIIIYTFSSFFF